MRVLLVDSGLTYGSGHHDHFFNGLASYLGRRDIELVCLANVRSVSIGSGRLKVLPVFNRSMYESSTNIYDGMLVDMQTASASFCDDLSSAALHISDDDLIIIPTATAGDVLGLSNWLAKVTNQPMVAALYHWGDDVWLQPGSLLAALHSYAIRQLRTNCGERLALAATHAPLANALTSLSGGAVSVASSATFFGCANFDATAAVASDERRNQLLPNIAILGVARPAKGEAIAPLVVRRAIARGLPVHWTVQCQTGSAWQQEYDALAIQSNVTLVRDWISDGALDLLIREADMLMLPYDAATYRAMVSGIFTLAAGYGVPCIVPSATWMSNRLDASEAAGVTFVNGSVDGIVDAVEVALDKIDLIQAAARQRAVAWQARYSAELYISELLSWAISTVSRQVNLLTNYR